MFPKVNDIVYMQVASVDMGEEREESKSRIAEVEEESFLIEVPINSKNGQMNRLYIGDELSVYFMTEDGVKNYFNSYVLGFAEDVVRLVRIRKPKPETITRVQRRDFLRVMAELEIAVRLNDNTKFLAYTEDVGGGGLSFLCSKQYKLSQGEHVFCWLLIPYKNGSIEHVPFEAEVVRTNKMETDRIVAMLKFISISDMERQKIIRYCFERQFDFKDR